MKTEIIKNQNNSLLKADVPFLMNAKDTGEVIYVCEVLKGEHYPESCEFVFFGFVIMGCTKYNNGEVMRLEPLDFKKYELFENKITLSNEL